MKYTDVNNNANGMILGENIYDNNGTLIAPKDSILTPKLIAAISNMGIKIILTEEDDDDELISEDKKEELTSFILQSINEKSFHGRKIYSPIVPAVTSVFTEILFDDYAMYILNKLSKIDSYSINHAINVAMLSGLIGKWMKLEDSDIRKAIFAGFFHQTGKIDIDKTLLTCDKKLNVDELQYVRDYIEFSKPHLEKIEIIDDDIKAIILQSCEYLDGSGYPNALKRDQIHPISKIVCVANIFDSAISKRPFKEAKTPFEICSELFTMSMDKLCPSVTTPLIRHIEASYHGLKVELSNGKVGEIVYTNKYDSKRPIIKISDTEFIDINSRDNDVKIVKML